jgi:hypothetical protein
MYYIHIKFYCGFGNKICEIINFLDIREEGKETDGRRNEDERYKDGRRGVEIHK